MCIENGSEYCSMKHKLILPLVRGVCLLLVMVGIVDNVIGQGSPYIATSQNYFCAGSANEVSMYCNVLAFDPGTNVADWEFSWSPSSEVSDPTAQSVTVAPANTTVYSAVMTAPDGTVYNDEITITVYPEFSVLTSDVSGCSTIGLNLTADVDVSNAMDWLWEPAFGLSNASIQNPQLFEELTQLYTVTATISGLGGASCSNSAEVQVTSIFPELELGPNVVACSEETVIIDPGLPLNYTYEWTTAGEVLPVLEVTNSGDLWGHSDLTGGMRKFGCRYGDLYRWSNFEFARFSYRMRGCWLDIGCHPFRLDDRPIRLPVVQWVQFTGRHIL